MSVPTETSEAPKSQVLKLTVAILVLVIAGAVAWWRLGGASAERVSAQRAFVDIETNKPFEHQISMGEIEPIESPFTKRLTGYRAEACYWTKDPNGEWKAKLEPTFVVLKTKIDPSSEEETFCPDCGHKVVGHNPMPPDELMQAAQTEARK